MAENVVTLTEQNWEREVVSSATPVLVDFWAEWCKPCIAMFPDIEAVAALYQGRLRVGKLNVEEYSDVAGRYNVTAMPTVLFLKEGRVLEQRVGKMSKDALVKLIEPLLARPGA
jgi:thioredoxin 1